MRVMRQFRMAALGWAAGVGLAGLAAATDAHAQEGVFFKDVLSSIGLIPEEKDPIEYRERAPLVLPPRMDLRAPVEAGSVQARNPQWPNDPDAGARRRKEADAKTPEGERLNRRGSYNGSTRLTPEELRSGRVAAKQAFTEPVPVENDSRYIRPEVLRSQSKKLRAAESEAAGDDEPAVRRTLTDPPSAYRASATGKPIRGSFEPQVADDESNPAVYLRNQRNRDKQ